jgi:hypothetical protein
MNFAPTRTAAALAALTAAFVAAPAANAETPANATSAADACGYAGTDVFAPWNDLSSYTLTQDGGFENGADGWTLDGGAAVADGNETFQVAGTADHQSLALPAGSSATSPAMCVARRDDVFRLFTRTDGGRDARLRVDVLYTDAAGDQESISGGELRGGDAWAPTHRLKIALARARSMGGPTTASVTVRFMPVGDGNWQIDDLYIDPRLRQ